MKNWQKQLTEEEIERLEKYRWVPLAIIIGIIVLITWAV